MIYLDNAATTKTDPSVVEAMLPYFSEDYGNASAAYRLGQKSKRAIDRARESLAKSIGASPSELYFTSGGSEADNWALCACFEAFPEKKHIITSAIEHPAILRTLSYLEKEEQRSPICRWMKKVCWIPPIWKLPFGRIPVWSASCLPITKSEASNPLTN